MGTKMTISDLKKLVREEVDRQMTKENNLNEAKKKPSVGVTKKGKSTVVKKAKSGEEIDKKGKEIEKTAKESGAKDPKAVAGAAMWKNIAKKKGK